MTNEARDSELWVVGTKIVSGAEYVMRDYLIRSKREADRVVVTSDMPEVVAFFSAIPKCRVYALKELAPVGASRGGVAVVLRKIRNTLSARRSIRQILRTEKPRVVIGNNSGDIAYVGAIRKIPKVVFVYDILTTQPMLHFMFRLYGKRLSALIAQSKAVMASLPKWLAESRKIAISYTGIELEGRRCNVDAGKRPDELVIGFVGNIEDRKDPLFLAGAVAEAMRLEPGMKLVVRLVYRVLDEGLFVRVQSALNGTGARIDYLGGVPRDELSEFYAGLDALCITSRNDPFPTVVIEALASGTPIIGRAIDGISEMYEDGKQGLFARDVEGFARAIIRFSRNGKEHAAFRKAAREYALQNYNIDARALSLDELIGRVTG